MPETMSSIANDKADNNNVNDDVLVVDIPLSESDETPSAPKTTHNDDDDEGTGVVSDETITRTKESNDKLHCETKPLPPLSPTTSIPKSALFLSTSNNHEPTLHRVSYNAATESLGCELINYDKNLNIDMFQPGYAGIKAFVNSNNTNNEKKRDIQLSDCIVGINGVGYRRFDFESASMTEKEKLSDSEKRVIGKRSGGGGNDDPGKNFYSMMYQLKDIKKKATEEENKSDNNNNNNNVELLLERCGWDHKTHSLKRFLRQQEINEKENSKDKDSSDQKGGPDFLIKALGELEKHEQWKDKYFPIDMTQTYKQEILKSGAISEIDINDYDNSTGSNKYIYPTIYMNYDKLSKLITEKRMSIQQILKVIIIYTEILLGKCPNPSYPQICHFIDISKYNWLIENNYQSTPTIDDPKKLTYHYSPFDILKELYILLDKQYPQTLCKVVVYPLNNNFLQNNEFLNLMVTSPDKIGSSEHITKTRINSFGKDLLQYTTISTCSNIRQLCTSLGWNTNSNTDIQNEILGWNIKTKKKSTTGTTTNETTTTGVTVSSLSSSVEQQLTVDTTESIDSIDSSLSEEQLSPTKTIPDDPYESLSLFISKQSKIKNDLIF